MKNPKKKWLWRGWYFDGEDIVSNFGDRFSEEYMRRIARLKTAKFWVGWSVDGEWLIDDGGNKYHVNDIRALFMERQVTKSVIGKDYHIRSLKLELENKIKALEPPRVEIIYGDGTKKIVKYQ